MASRISRTAQDEFDDIYEGFEDSSLLGTEKEVLEDALLQRSIQSSYGERSRENASLRNLRGTSRMGIETAKAGPRSTSTAKLSTGSRNDTFRPTSSIRGIGYSAKSNRSATSSGVASPSGRRSSATPILVPPLDPVDDEQPSKTALGRFRRLEKDIRALLDEVVVLVAKNLFPQALEKVKQVDRLRRNLNDISDWNPKDKAELLLPLLFKINWHYAEVLALNHKFNEAVKMYTELHNTATKDQQSLILSRIAVIHRRRGEYEQALRLIHKLLDDLSGDGSSEKIEILHQGAACYALMNRWETAYKYCQMILQDSESPKAAFNSVICLVSMKADPKKIENAFLRLIAIKPIWSASSRLDSSASQDYLDSIQDDSLSQWEKAHKATCEKYIRSAAQLVAALDDDVIAGYDWCIAQLKTTSWTDLVVALEMAKASTFLKQDQYQKTIDILTSHDNDYEDNRLRSQSCGLLTFLYFNLDNMKAAREYAVKAYSANKLSTSACTNMGCMEYANGDYTAALQYFQEALILNSSDYWASYYAGLTLSALGSYQDALAVFTKLNSSHCQRPTVLYQISRQHELLGQDEDAFNALQALFALHPHEPFVLEKLGGLADKLGDKGAALWYYNESHRVYPGNTNVLNWLGRFFVASQFPEKAIKFFEQAEKLDPSVSKWSLLVAGAMRRARRLTDAYNKYLEIHDHFPDDTDCLRFLIKICSDTHAPASEIRKYQEKLDSLRRLTLVGESETGRMQTGRRSTPMAADTVGMISERLSTARLSTGRQSAVGLASLPSRSRQTLSLTGGLSIDADDLEQFNIRPGTAKLTRPVPPAIIEAEDLTVDDILPGLR